MRLRLLILFLLLLAGCASGVKAPEVVKVPVPVACVSEIPLGPELRWETLPADSSPSIQVRALMLDYFDLRGDGAVIRLILEGCKGTLISN